MDLYPMYAEFNQDQPRRVFVDGTNYRKPYYLVSLKFWMNFGIYRVNGFGPSNEVNRNTLRKLYTAYTGKAAPKKFDDLMAGFASAGFTVMEITPSKKAGVGNSYRELVA